jgi:hypothetical protein
VVWFADRLALLRLLEPVIEAAQSYLSSSWLCAVSAHVKNQTQQGHAPPPPRPRAPDPPAPPAPGS